MKGKKSKPNAIEKALFILKAFYPRNAEMGTVEVSQKTGLEVPTVNRILKVLARNRFLHQNPLTKKFQLGPSILSLGEAARESLNNNLLRMAIPYLDELCHNVSETVVLEVLLGESGIAAYVVQGRQTISIRASVGTRLPTHAAAGSKAILAFSSPETVKGFLERKLSRFTDTTITKPEKLLLEIETIRKEGVAYSREEIDVGVNAIAMPILTYEKLPVAAVTVVGPSTRVLCNKESSVVAELSKTVAIISAHLR